MGKAEIDERTAKALQTAERFVELQENETWSWLYEQLFSLQGLFYRTFSQQQRAAIYRSLRGQQLIQALLQRVTNQKNRARCPHAVTRRASVELPLAVWQMLEQEAREQRTSVARLISFKLALPLEASFSGHPED